MKYIMIEVDIDGQKMLIPIIFPKAMIHSLVARSIQHMIGMKHKEWGDTRVVSAGELILRSAPVTQGESETLKLRAKKEDGQTIFQHPYLHGLQP